MITIAALHLLRYITRYLESFHFQLRQVVNIHHHTRYTVLIDIHHTLFRISLFPVKTAEKYTRSHQDTILTDIHYTLFGIFPFPVKTASKYK